jgi:hypothetical protein
MSKIFYLSYLITGFLLASNGQGSTLFEEGNTMDILGKVKNSFNWTDSISMRVEIKTTIIGIPDKRPYKTIFTIYKNHDNIKLDGDIFIIDANDQPVPKTSTILKKIATDKEYIDITGSSGHLPSGAMITNNFKEKKENLLDTDNFGGPLFARISGTNHNRVIDLIGESNDIYIREQQESINDINCYILEGKAKYGKVTIWFSPDNGYSVMKWKIEKTDDDLINDSTMSKNMINTWVSQYEIKEIQHIGEYYIPKIAKYELMSTLKDGSNITISDIYTISDVQLVPDFDALGAFKIDLPEGTRVTISETPGIRYIWKEGTAVVDVNNTKFEEIDKTIDKFKQNL